MKRNIKKVFSIIVSSALLINLLFQNVVLAEVVATTGGEGTCIGGIISNNTTLILEDSPYILNEDIQIAYGTIVNIEPGVIIKGNNNNIKTWGILNAIGTKENKIKFENVNIKLNGTNSQRAFIDIQFSEINGGSLISAGGNGQYGNFNLRDSNIKNTSNYMYVWYPTSDVNIERNVFENAGGISVGTSDNVKVNIKNNVFYKQNSGFAIKNWASYGTSETIVEYNSFLSTDKIALELPKGYNSAKLTAKNNYWGTEDLTIIEKMIYDKDDDLASAAVIEMLPILTEPNENTPIVDFSELVVALTKPENSEKYVTTNEDIVIKFNNNVQVGEQFDQISVKDNNGYNMLISKTIEGNTLRIKKDSNWNKGMTYSVFVPQKSVQDPYGNYLSIDYKMMFSTCYEDNVTPIGGIILNDTILTLTNSPYIITENLQIAYGVKLSIEPGVIVKGNNYNINIWGILNAIGTKENKIKFENVNIKLNGTNSQRAFIDIQFSEINGGSLISAGGNGQYGTFNLRDSNIKNTSNYMYVWYPTSDVNIERNVFENAGGISVGTSDSVKVNIKNNVFYKQNSGFAIKNWASYGTSETIVEYNSFLSTDKIALELPKGYNSAKLSAKNNYWGTEDLTIIEKMIYDKNDDLASAAVIEVLPILTEPSENTPIVDYSELVLVLSNPNNQDTNIPINKEMKLSFNKNIYPGDKFEEITVTNAQGEIIPILKVIDKNTININVEKFLNYNTEYTIRIPKESLKDSYNNNLSSDCSIRFTTKDETNTTVISGIISSDTRLAIENSPYELNDNIQIAYGVTLSIEPGVIVKGNNYNINTWGILSSIGTEANKIKFENVNIKLNGINSQRAFIDIQYSEINGGSLISAGGNGQYGTFNLRDSNIKNTSNYMYIWYPTSDVNIERNIFENAGGISVGTSDNVKVNIKNNVFYKQNSGFAIKNWASYGTSETIVEYNSFLSTDKIALELPTGYDNAKLSAKNNYWNTEDTEVIDNMIFDKNDDLGSSGIVRNILSLSERIVLTGEADNKYISYEPFLIEKDNNTPNFIFNNPILSFWQFQYRNNKTMIDKPITIKFNKDVFKGSTFDNIQITDSEGNVIPANTNINGNELIITPKNYMNYNKKYNLIILKDSIKDKDGNIIESDISNIFYTEDPRIDINQDNKIDILDLSSVALKYNLTLNNIEWNSLYDFNGDEIIDLYDLIMISTKVVN